MAVDVEKRSEYQGAFLLSCLSVVCLKGSIPFLYQRGESALLGVFYAVIATSDKAARNPFGRIKSCYDKL